MGVVWKNNKDITVAIEWVKGKFRETVFQAVDDINAAMDDAAGNMETTIETVPSSIVPGKIGRVDTGLMLDSVEVDYMKKTGKNKFVGKVGWVNTQEDYFKYQEYGTGDKSGEGGVSNISPMHALTGARIQLIEDLKGRFG